MRFPLLTFTVCLICTIANTSHSQLWVGSDDFNAPTLNSSKWITITGLSDGLVKTSSAISFQNGGYTGELYGMVAWAQPLPLNASWTAQINAKINPSFNTGVTGGFGNGKYLEAIFGLVSDLSSFTYQFGNILHRDNNTDISYSVSTQGFWPYTQIDTPTSMTDVILKFDYNPTTKTIASFYADSNTPSIFYGVSTLNVTPYTGLSQMYITAGGFSYGVNVPSETMIMDNFMVIPEPSVLSLCAVGLGGLAMMRRRRS